MMTFEEPQKAAVQNMFTKDKIELIKNTICKNCSDDEMELFLHACKRTGLDPFMKQIHAVKRGDYEAMTIQTGIDGYRLIAERTGRYCPGREPTFNYDKNGKLVSATSYVKKQTRDGSWHEVAGTAFFLEYCQRKKDGSITKFWEKMPHGQLAKCAEALALRKAFPSELSGVLTNEEMEQAQLYVDENDKPKSIEVVTTKKHEAESKKPIEPTVYEKINQAQVVELQNLLKECSYDQQEKVIKDFNKRNWIEMEDIPMDSYISIKKYLLELVAKNRAESMAKELDKQTGELL